MLSKFFENTTFLKLLLGAVIQWALFDGYDIAVYVEEGRVGCVGRYREFLLRFVLFRLIFSYIFHLLQYRSRSIQILMQRASSVLLWNSFLHIIFQFLNHHSVSLLCRFLLTGKIIIFKALHHGTAVSKERIDTSVVLMALKLSEN